MSGVVAAAHVEHASELGGEARQALRDLILVLADSKRLLGIRYADWMLGAPTIEAGIAASSMAQDEWGHSRLTYALLADFGDDPKALEHEREAVAYRNPEALDRPLASWAELIAVALMLDTALSVQYDALLDSRYQPVHNRVQKLLDEERFHFQHAVGWARRLAQSSRVRSDFHAAVEHLLPQALRWFGREDSEAARRLVAEKLVRGGPEQLRARYLASVAPVLESAGLTDALGLAQRNGEWTFGGALDWAPWSELTRRAAGGGPDADTLSRVRGDRNRTFLMD